MSERELHESVADAIAAGDVVDWHDVQDAAATSRDADLIHQLRIIAAIGATRRVRAPRGPTRWSRTLEAVVAVVLTMALAQLTLAILGTPAALARVAWPYIVNALIFGVGGVVLLAGGGRDRRLPLLGGLFLTISSAFGATMMPAPGVGIGGPLTAVLHLLQPEAFLPLMLWRFVRAFPAETQRSGARRVANGFRDVSFGVGAVLFVTNAIGRIGDSTMPSWVMTLFELLGRNYPERIYWPLLFAIAAPAIPFLLWKTRFETYEAHRRVLLFVGALGVGLTPFLLAVVATPFVPALRDPSVQQRIGVLLYGALASIAPVTAYSVAVERVMDLKFFIRTTLQYALARYAVWAVSLGPLAYVAFDVHANQELAVADYLERLRPTGPLALSSVGLIALALRRRLLRAIDRWFLLEPPDQTQTLARLEQRFRRAESLRGVTGSLVEELRRALHATSVAVLLVNDDGTGLVPVEGTTAQLPHDSVLLDVLRSTRNQIQLDSHAPGSVARLFPPSDREWLDDAGAHVLFPLIGSTGMFLGVVAIGEARTGLPYSTAHYALATATSGQAAMQIENRWLRGCEASESRPGGVPRGPGLNWEDEPAAHCPACSLVWSPETRRCSCGTSTIPVTLPLFVQRKFRLERLVGMGGMGVVYLAVDVVLDRQVAIKTLPSLRPESAERMHREARAMAAVLHPNLALIYGTEQWHDTPMLIVEYLDGGTLRDRIRRGPLSYVEAIDLGTVLADVLDRVHASGVLHRDVKPSNIGFTGDGRPKLLDFGLALLGRTQDPGRQSGCATAALLRSADPATTVTVAERLVGTPLYMSPEALAGTTPQPSFDLWGLALVLYEAIAGRHPFAADDVAAVLAAAERADVPDIRNYRPTCPVGLAAFLRDALSRKVAQRPASAGAMRTDLRRLHASVDQRAH